MKKTWAVMGTAVAVSAMIFTGCGTSRKDMICQIRNGGVKG